MEDRRRGSVEPRLVEIRMYRPQSPKIRMSEFRTTRESGLTNFTNLAGKE